MEHLVHTLKPPDYSKVQDRLASLINHSPKERYLDLIKTQPELLGRVPLNQIASYIGISPRNTAAIFMSLRRHGERSLQRAITFAYDMVEVNAHGKF